MARDGLVFVTGCPGFIARRLVRHLAEKRGPGLRLALLARPQSAERARADAAALGVAEAEVLEGDVARMHLGLAGHEVQRLRREVAEIWHLAAHSDLSADPRRVRAVNLEGTRGVLELARSCRRLEALHHFSTASVSGSREGVILEDELEMGQSFPNPYEESKYQAERLVRAAQADLPAVIYRPAIVVGDSRTGEIDRFAGPYSLAILLVTSPLAMALPLPRNGIAPLNAVPVDFAVEAAAAIAANPASVGRTVHLVDPAPLSVRRVYEEIARRAGRSLPPVSIPHRAVEALLSLPLLDRLARPQRAAVELLNRIAVYNARNMLELLAGTGILCPPITAYLDRLIDFVRNHYAEAALREARAAADPLDPDPAPGVAR
ncbi:MAG TPA: SDR family oxidoreductase [Anaeromyxobacteraceae bacterium]